MTTTDQLENAVERYLLKQCRKHGFMCLKFVSPARVGVPDRVIITPAGTVFVEVKRPGGKLRRSQQVMHRKMRGFGAQIHVVDDDPSVDTLIEHLADKAATHPDRQKEAS